MRDSTMPGAQRRALPLPRRLRLRLQLLQLHVGRHQLLLQRRQLRLRSAVWGAEAGRRSLASMLTRMRSIAMHAVHAAQCAKARPQGRRALASTPTRMRSTTTHKQARSTHLCLCQQLPQRLQARLHAGADARPPGGDSRRRRQQRQAAAAVAKVMGSTTKPSGANVASFATAAALRHQSAPAPACACKQDGEQTARAVRCAAAAAPRRTTPQHTTPRHATPRHATPNTPHHTTPRHARPVTDRGSSFWPRRRRGARCTAGRTRAPPCARPRPPVRRGGCM